MPTKSCAGLCMLRVTSKNPTEGRCEEPEIVDNGLEKVAAEQEKTDPSLIKFDASSEV